MANKPISDMAQATIVGWINGPTGLKRVDSANAEFLGGLNITGQAILTGSIWPAGLGNDGQILSTDGNGQLIWADDTGGAVSMDELTDADTTTVLPKIDDRLVWDSTNWVPGKGTSGSSLGGSDVYKQIVSGVLEFRGLESSDTTIGIGTNTGTLDLTLVPLSMDDLTDADTTTTGPVDGDHLEWNGNEWVPEAPSIGGTTEFLSNFDTQKICGRITDGNGNSEELTDIQVRDIINVEDGAAANQDLGNLADFEEVGWASGPDGFYKQSPTTVGLAGGLIASGNVMAAGGTSGLFASSIMFGSFATLVLAGKDIQYGPDSGIDSHSFRTGGVEQMFIHSAFTTITNTILSLSGPLDTSPSELRIHANRAAGSESLLSITGTTISNEGVGAGDVTVDAAAALILDGTTNVELHVGADVRLRVNDTNMVSFGSIRPAFPSSTSDLGDATYMWRSGYFGTGVQTPLINTAAGNLKLSPAGAVDISGSLFPTDLGISGQILSTDGNGQLDWVTNTGGDPLAIDDLTDVDTTTAAPNLDDVLTWNGTDNWIPGAAGGGASAIDDLTDVDTTTAAPNSGEVLTWNGTNNWVPNAKTGTVNAVFSDSPVFTTTLTTPQISVFNPPDESITLGTNGSVNLIESINTSLLIRSAGTDQMSLSAAGTTFLHQVLATPDGQLDLGTTNFAFKDTYALGTGYFGTSVQTPLITTAAGNLTLTPAGVVDIDGSLWPATVGSADELLSTDGLGQLSWVPPNAATVTVADENVDATNFVLFANDATGSQAVKSQSLLTYNALNTSLSCPTMVATTVQATSIIATGDLDLNPTGDVKIDSAIITGTRQASITLSAPVDTDLVPWFIPDEQILLLGFKAYIQGGTSVDLNIRFGSNPSTATTDVFTADQQVTEKTTIETTFDTPANGAIAANDAVLLEITAVVGDVTSVHFVLQYIIF